MSVAFFALWLYFHKQAFLVLNSIKRRLDKQGPPYLVTLVTVFYFEGSRGRGSQYSKVFLCQFHVDKLGCTETAMCGVEVLFINWPGSVHTKHSTKAGV